MCSFEKTVQPMHCSCPAVGCFSIYCNADQFLPVQIFSEEELMHSEFVVEVTAVLFQVVDKLVGVLQLLIVALFAMTK